MDVKGKKITILGMGESGLAAARFLRGQDARVFVSEGRKTERTQRANEALKKEGFDTECGNHTKEKICDAEFIVISPGISPRTPVYQMIESARIPLWSEIEVASWFTKQKVIAVTGTNGKTTVTTLIARMLNENGISALSCGNIGNPFVGEISRINEEGLMPVVEVSSFQLMNTRSFRPHIALLLNLDPDHLDWHHDLAEYYETKIRLFKNQNREDFALLNRQDHQIQKYLPEIPSQKVFFNDSRGPAQSPQWNPNLDACVKTAEILGIDKGGALQSLISFEGLEHRLERVPSPDEWLYINDSKSTNLSSLVWALERLIDSQKNSAPQIILILGGKNKGGDFSSVKTLLSNKTKHIILMGEAQDEIASRLDSSCSYEKSSSLEEAVLCARAQARAGDVILFSPACASFDMFINYIDRGRQFKSLVAKLTQSCPKTVSAS